MGATGRAGVRSDPVGDDGRCVRLAEPRRPPLSTRPFPFKAEAVRPLTTAGRGRAADNVLAIGRHQQVPPPRAVTVVSVPCFRASPEQPQRAGRHDAEDMVGACSLFYCYMFRGAPVPPSPRRRATAPARPAPSTADPVRVVPGGPGRLPSSVTVSLPTSLPSAYYLAPPPAAPVPSFSWAALRRALALHGCHPLPGCLALPSCHALPRCLARFLARRRSARQRR